MTQTFINKSGLKTIAVSGLGIIQEYKKWTAIMGIGNEIRCDKGFNGELLAIEFNELSVAEITVCYHSDGLKYILGIHQVWSPEFSTENSAFTKS